MSDIDSISKLINDYALEREKINPFLALMRESRKYGFPFINKIDDKSEEEQLVWAASLALSLVLPRPEGDEINNDIFIQAIKRADVNSTALTNDANTILAIANGNTRYS